MKKPSNKTNSLAERAIALLQKTRKVRDLVLVHTGDAADPATGDIVHEFVAVSKADPNGPSHRVVLGADGSPREHMPGPDPLTLASSPVHVPATALAAPVTVQPDTNVLTLNPGETLDETITVTIPKNAGTPKADVYFLADTTGSMGGVLAAVQAGANNILTALSGLGLDLMFGVGNYKDFPPASPSPFHSSTEPDQRRGHHHSRHWDLVRTRGRRTFPKRTVPRAGPVWPNPRVAVSVGAQAAKRIIVWFGDAPGHDPICTAISGLGSAITEATVTASWSPNRLSSWPSPPPRPAWTPTRCPVPRTTPALAGLQVVRAGQATRLAAATGGAFVTGINPTTIVNTIIALVTAAVSSINNVNLVPSATIAPFVVSITPAGRLRPAERRRGTRPQV